MEGSAGLETCSLSHGLASRLSVDFLGVKESHSVIEAGLVVTGSPGTCGHGRECAVGEGASLRTLTLVI